MTTTTKTLWQHSVAMFPRLKLVSRLKKKNKQALWAARYLACCVVWGSFGSDTQCSHRLLLNHYTVQPAMSATISPFHSLPWDLLGCLYYTLTAHFPHKINQRPDFAPGSVTHRQCALDGVYSVTNRMKKKKRGWGWTGGGWTLGTSCCWHDTKVWKPGGTPNPSWSMKGGSSWLWIWTLMPAS